MVPVSSGPPQTYLLLATQRHVNWPAVHPESSYKIIDPVSVAPPQNLRRIFVATLLLYSFVLASQNTDVMIDSVLLLPCILSQGY